MENEQVKQGETEVGKAPLRTLKLKAFMIEVGIVTFEPKILQGTYRRFISCRKQDGSTVPIMFSEAMDKEYPEDKTDVLELSKYLVVIGANAQGEERYYLSNKVDTSLKVTDFEWPED